MSAGAIGWAGTLNLPMNFLRTSVLGGLATVALTAVSGTRSFAQAVPGPQPQSPQGQPSQSIETTQAPEQRIPQQAKPRYGAFQGILYNDAGQPLPGIGVELAPVGGNKSGTRDTASEGDGIFRLLNVAPGTYDLVLTPASGRPPYRKSGIVVNAGEVLSVQIDHLTGFEPPQPGLPIPQAPMEETGGNYMELNRRPDANGEVVVPKEGRLPQENYLFQPLPDRWYMGVPDAEGYRRYPALEVPYVLGHWYDPFNRNELKGDKPLFGKTFFQFTGDSITVMDGRRLPVKSGQSTDKPDSLGFFGRGGQFFTAQTFRMTFDLFHGDTTAFRPVDWRIRVTPAVNLNYLLTRENQIVSPDVRFGTTRFDYHASLQEAFGEVKLKDLGPNYDFVNVRLGIQQFVSDFRGFIYADEQPGARIFGNLRSNRYQYNLAAFDLMEKDSNSGLNTFRRRGRDVIIANLFMQDFFAKGYTAQVSYHFVRDNGRMHYDDNGFLVRPSPLGSIAKHRTDVNYFGFTGDGHIGPYNITNAFYEARGDDTFDQIAARKVDINAQLAAVEISRDYSYMRFRGSFFYASGDSNPRDGSARGFDSIVDAEAFAGGEFSFFNRESIRLTGTGIALTPGDSFLPDLRSSKDEGQSNFTNPGLYLYNAGADAKLTQSLKVVGNVNFLQFAHTQPLVFILQQNGIRRTIGTDASLGAIYRPFLSDNIILSGGAAVLVPGRGLRDFYTSQTLFSVFATARFQF
jgi:hypothetical protein